MMKHQGISVSMTSGGLQGELQVWGLVVCVGTVTDFVVWGGSSEAVAVQGEDGGDGILWGSARAALALAPTWQWKCVV